MCELMSSQIIVIFNTKKQIPSAERFNFPVYNTMELADGAYINILEIKSCVYRLCENSPPEHFKLQLRVLLYYTQLFSSLQ